MIHETAVVHADARLAEDVEVGAYSVIGGGVEIGAGTRVGPHVVIEGPTRIGAGNRIFQFASLGADPQDKKYDGEETRLVIGEGNTIREFVTINRGTAQDRSETRIGDDNWIMAYVHIAHDCVIGDHTIMANCATLAGHVEIHDHAILGGFTKVHQFCRVGRHAFCGMDCGITRDVPPFIMVSGHPAEPKGINSEGLKRHGFDSAEIAAAKQAYRTLYRQGLKLEEALEALRGQAESVPALSPLPEFVAATRRSIVR